MPPTIAFGLAQGLGISTWSSFKNEKLLILIEKTETAAVLRMSCHVSVIFLHAYTFIIASPYPSDRGIFRPYF